MIKANNKMGVLKEKILFQLKYGKSSKAFVFPSGLSASKTKSPSEFLFREKTPTRQMVNAGTFLRVMEQTWASFLPEMNTTLRGPPADHILTDSWQVFGRERQRRRRRRACDGNVVLLLGTRQSPWVETRGVPVASRRGQILLAVFDSTRGLPMRFAHAACHCFNSGTLPCTHAFAN